MDGWITIGTKLDTKGLEKDMKVAERELQKYQKDSEKLTKQKLKYEADLSQYENEIAEYDKLIAKAGEYERTIEKLKSQGYRKVEQIIPLQNELGEVNRQLEEQTPKIDQTHMKYEQTRQEIENINKQLKENTKQQQEITGKIEETNQKLKRINIKDNVTGELGKTSNKLTSILGKVARWALAIFSIRSIYSTLSSASATLAQYNEQYAANLEYIRFALAQMLAPVLEYIVRLMYTILQYINMIAQAWFGVNLFANASADAFTKAKSSTGKIAKNAEKTRKELQQTNFDEMNVLQDNTASKSSGDSAGGAAPSMDLSKMGDVEAPAWLQWIIDHKDEILKFLATVAILIAGIKIYQLVKGIGQLFGGISALKALGITAMILGIVWAVAGLIQYLKDPTWENFGKIIQGIGIFIIGLGAVINSLPVAVIGAAILIHGTIMKNWDKIKDTLTRGVDWFHEKSEELQNWLDKKLDWLPEKFGSVGQVIKETIKIAVKTITTFIEELFRTIIDIFDRIYSGIRQVVDGIIKIFKGDFKGGIEDVGKGILKIFTGIWEGTYLGFVTVWKTILKLFENGGKIFDGFKDGIIGTLKSLLNILISGVNWAIARPLNALNNTLNRIKDIKINLGSFGSFTPFSGFYSYNPIPVPQIPKLARGTILNNPGNGVPVAGGRAIAGEAGREAYLPLSDKQLLEELGSTIGKYITINATVNNSMNGRLISRIMQQIKTEQDFAYNT